jgi:hypothetical protein
MFITVNIYETQKHYNYSQSIQKQRVFTKAIKNDNLESLCWSNKRRGGAQVLTVICAGLPSGVEKVSR